MTLGAIGFDAVIYMQSAASTTGHPASMRSMCRFRVATTAACELPGIVLCRVMTTDCCSRRIQGL